MSGLYESAIEVFDDEDHNALWTAAPSPFRTKGRIAKVANRWSIHRIDGTGEEEHDSDSGDYSKSEGHYSSGECRDAALRYDFSTRVINQDMVGSSCSLGGPDGQVYLVHDESVLTCRTLRILFKSKQTSTPYLELGHFAFNDCCLHLDVNRLRRTQTDVAFVICMLETVLAMRDEAKGGSSRRDDLGRIKAEGGLFSRFFSDRQRTMSP